MQNQTTRKSSFKAGMYLLETLTSGMYNEPLSMYREYLQNAVDSIDLVGHKGKETHREINIDLNPIQRSIKIYDNGLGIPSAVAEETLSAIGSSNKAGKGLRGFRGIGRLGGIAFSDKAIYRTKALGEEVESIQEWDCKELKKILSDPKKSSLSLKQVFRHITKFYQSNTKSSIDSYFEVLLEGVSSFRNHTLDIARVRNYLIQVAPVNFNPDEFSFGEIINEYLLENLNRYCSYNINLKGEPVYKPYHDRVKLTKKGYDNIDSVRLFEIKGKDRPIGYGWYGKRRNLLGSISKGDVSSGIRLRVGNILLGNAHLLDECFREPRFNSYMIGEIHIDCPELIPNSRRDDFIDNEMKTMFFNAVERKVGLPNSKEIRLRSRLASNLPRRPSKKAFRVIPENTQAIMILNEMIKSCEGCPKLSELLSKIKR